MHRQQPRLANHLLLLLAALAASACNGTTLGERTGPDFDVAFPDARTLVTTSDPSSVREVLATVQLPQTQQHHDRLISLLDSQSTIPAANLLLLVEAVAPPKHSIVIYQINDQVWTYGQRGKGEFSTVADTLITNGTPKLTDVTRDTLGALIGRTQSDAAMKLLADRFVPELDDGSDGALHAILDGMPGSPASMPFLTEYMIPTGRLEGERGWQCMRLCTFDNQRTSLVTALAQRQASIDEGCLLTVVEAMDFDSGQNEAVDLLAGKVGSMSPGMARKIAAKFSFDSGRGQALATLANAGALKFTEPQLLSMVKLYSFDSGRKGCIEMLAPHLHGESTGSDARALLKAFSFDSARQEVIEIMAPRWRLLTSEEQRALAKTFSFDSGREAAANALR